MSVFAAPECSAPAPLASNGREIVDRARLSPAPGSRVCEFLCGSLERVRFRRSEGQGLFEYSQRHLGTGCFMFLPSSTVMSKLAL